MKFNAKVEFNEFMSSANSHQLCTKLRSSHIAVLGLHLSAEVAASEVLAWFEIVRVIRDFEISIVSEFRSPIELECYKYLVRGRAHVYRLNSIYSPLGNESDSIKFEASEDKLRSHEVLKFFETNVDYIFTDFEGRVPHLQKRRYNAQELSRISSTSMERIFRGRTPVKLQSIRRNEVEI